MNVKKFTEKKKLFYVIENLAPDLYLITFLRLKIGSNLETRGAH
jgi:hypothetical protein